MWHFLFFLRPGNDAADPSDMKRLEILPVSSLFGAHQHSDANENASCRQASAESAHTGNAFTRAPPDDASK